MRQLDRDGVALCYEEGEGSRPSCWRTVGAATIPTSRHSSSTSLLNELRGPDYREVLRGYASRSLFIPTDDEQREERKLQSMSSAPQHVVVSAFEGLRDCEPTEAAGGLAVPGVYIAADELQPRSDMARFHEMFSYILYGKTVGSGHLCQLEVPEQVNAMIDRFLAVTLPRWHARQNGLSRSVASSRLMPTLTPAGR